MKKKLKPCPFCGSEALLEQLGDHHGDYYNLGCSDRKCIAHHVLYTCIEDDMPLWEAVKAWNARSNEEV